MPSHPLTNFEIQKYYQNQPKFNGIFSRNNGFKSIGSHWMALQVKNNGVTCFDSFGVKHIPKAI